MARQAMVTSHIFPCRGEQHLTFSHHLLHLSPNFGFINTVNTFTQQYIPKLLGCFPSPESGVPLPFPRLSTPRGSIAIVLRVEYIDLFIRHLSICPLGIVVVLRLTLICFQLGTEQDVAFCWRCEMNRQRV